MSATAPNYTAQCVAADQQHASSLFLGSGSTTISRIAADCVKQNFNPIFLSMGAGFGMNLVSAPGLKDHLWEPFQAAPFFATNIPAVQAANTAIDKYFPPLTFTAGQPHNINCSFTTRVQNGIPALVNNGQVSCVPGLSS